MSQAAGLAETVRLARTVRDVTVICYTGYPLERLIGRRAPLPGVAALLARIDVLIDGPYMAGLDDGRGLRGSTNQRVHHLTGRLSGYPFETSPREVELRIGTTEALLVGVPPPGLLTVLDHATQQLEDAGLVTGRGPAQPIGHAKESP